MSPQTLHEWHRETFAIGTPVTLQFPERSTTFGGTFPAETRDVTLRTARAAVCQRVINGLSPAEWTASQQAFDASDDGQALDTDDASDRRAHCELWLLHKLYTSDHPGLPAGTELALYMLVEEHANPAKIKAHRKALLASLEVKP